MKTLPMAPLVSSEPMHGEERQIVRGISSCHNQINKLAAQVFTSSVNSGAVAAVLQARGLITEQELEAQRQAEGERLAVIFQERQIGVNIDTSEPDKYALSPDALPIIDCENRYHLCHAACCALRFALSVQDLEEGVVRWELGEPYRNRIGGDSLCVHLDRGTSRCSVYEHRPAVCRVYSCRSDSRIWWDFEKMEINPNLYTDGPDGRSRFRFIPRDQEAPDDATRDPVPSMTAGAP